MPRKRSSPPPEIPADHVDAASDDDEEQPIESDPQNDAAEEHKDDEEEEESQEEDAESDGEGEGEGEGEAPLDANEQSVEKQDSSQGSESIGKESGSDPGSGSESDKSSPSPVPVKPIRSKPMKVLSKKADPKPKRKRASVKRDSDKNVKGGNKRARGVSNGDEKRSGINRIWSEEDEIVLLQGMIDYQLANDEDPYFDLEAFYEFVKDSLHVTVSIKQLSDKIRRLKKKFLVNADKGDDVVFVKPHDNKSFELSKKIWAGGKGGEDGGSKVKGGRKKKDKEIGKSVNNNGVNGKDDVVMEDEIENGVEADEEEDEGLDFKAMYPYLSKAWESDHSCSQPLKEISVGNFGLIASEKVRAMDKECKDMYVKEMQLYVKKLDLKSKHAKVVLDQMISSVP